MSSETGIPPSPTNPPLQCTPRQPRKHPIATSYGELKATFSACLVCAAVQRGKRDLGPEGLCANNGPKNISFCKIRGISVGSAREGRPCPFQFPRSRTALRSVRWAIKQRIQRSHIPQCQRHMVIATTLSVHCPLPHLYAQPCPPPTHAQQQPEARCGWTARASDRNRVATHVQQGQ